MLENIFQSTNCFILDKLIRTREATPGMIYRFEGKPKFVYQLLEIDYKYMSIFQKKTCLDYGEMTKEAEPIFIGCCVLRSP